MLTLTAATRTMGKANKALEAFIKGIPDAKLTSIPTTAGTLHKDTDFRLDMQGVGVDIGSGILTERSNLLLDD